MADITIVVPVYNVEKYINLCVESILRQTYQDFSLILVDDGSTDNCGHICDQYAKNDNRISVIHKKNGGLSDARNAAIDRVNTKFITFIDSDDTISKYYLSILLSVITESGADIAQADFTREVNDLDNEGKSNDLFIYDNTTTLLKEYFTLGKVEKAAWGKVYATELFQDIRYPVGKLYEDSFTTYKLLLKVKKFARVSNLLYFYRINNSSIMHSFSKNRFDILSIRNDVKNNIGSRYFELKDYIDYFYMRFAFYTYNDCIQAGMSSEFRDEMQEIEKNIRNLNPNTDIWEKKYVFMYHLMKFSPHMYAKWVQKFRKS